MKIKTLTKPDYLRPENDVIFMQADAVLAASPDNGTIEDVEFVDWTNS